MEKDKHVTAEVAESAEKRMLPPAPLCGLCDLGGEMLFGRR